MNIPPKYIWFIFFNKVTLLKVTFIYFKDPSWAAITEGAQDGHLAPDLK